MEFVSRVQTIRIAQGIERWVHIYHDKPRIIILLLFRIVIVPNQRIVFAILSVKASRGRFRFGPHVDHATAAASSNLFDDLAKVLKGVFGAVLGIIEIIFATYKDNGIGLVFV